MPADSLVKNWLHRIKNQFYPDAAKEFYQQKNVLIVAITTPARWLDERGVQLPEARIDAILAEIVRGVMHHGDTGRIVFFCRYFLKVVQDHMDHHGEVYYEEGKSLRFIVTSAVETLTKKQAARIPDAQDRTTAELAALNRLVKATKLRRRPPARKTATQQELF